MPDKKMGMTPEQFNSLVEQLSNIPGVLASVDKVTAQPKKRYNVNEDPMASGKAIPSDETDYLLALLTGVGALKSGFGRLFGGATAESVSAPVVRSASSAASQTADDLAQALQRLAANESKYRQAAAGPWKTGPLAEVYKERDALGSQIEQDKLMRARLQAQLRSLLGE